MFILRDWRYFFIFFVFKEKYYELIVKGVFVRYEVVYLVEEFVFLEVCEIEVLKKLYDITYAVIYFFGLGELLFFLMFNNLVVLKGWEIWVIFFFC